jgi:hypothetical protein
MKNTPEVKGLSAVEAFYAVVIYMYDTAFSHIEDGHAFFLTNMFSANEESAFDIIHDFCKSNLTQYEGVLFDDFRVMHNLQEDVYEITLYSEHKRKLFIMWDRHLGCPIGGYWV